MSKLDETGLAAAYAALAPDLHKGYSRGECEGGVISRYYTRAVRSGDRYTAMVCEIGADRVIYRVEGDRADEVENEAAAMAGVPWHPVHGWGS